MEPGEAIWVREGALLRPPEVLDDGLPTIAGEVLLPKSREVPAPLDARPLDVLAPTRTPIPPAAESRQLSGSTCGTGRWARTVLQGDADDNAFLHPHSRKEHSLAQDDCTEGHEQEP